MPHSSPPTGAPGPRRSLAAFVLAAALPVSAAAAPQPSRTGTPGADAAYRDAGLPVPARVRDLLGRMTLEEKAGQMAQAERAAVTAEPGAITTLGLGSVLSGGGSVPAANTPAGWADMVDGFQRRALATRLRIPLLYGVDSVHGHGNLVGATVFPHNLAMGATRDPALVREEERIAAEETRATGPQWVFAPCVCVTRDLRWGRSYESYGEDPALVTAMETGIEGFQGRGGGDLADTRHVLATAKHFAGDGDTAFGTSKSPFTIDQGVTVTGRAHFERTDLPPYATAVRKYHVGSVMPSFSSVDWTEDGVGNPVKMSANRELLTGVLKDRIGFRGFLVSDWEAVHQLPGDYAEQVRTAVNAGMDMFMEPYTAPDFVRTLAAEVRAGRVPQARVDDAVRRILTAKFELGLFEHPFTDRSRAAAIGSAAHRAVARRAVAESQVLLKNSGGALPLRPSQRVYVAGGNADDLGAQSGGWTVTWQGGRGAAIPGTTILQAVRRRASRVVYSPDASASTKGSDVGIVVVGESPYAEGAGDVGNGHTLDLAAADAAAVTKVCRAVRTCVVLDVAGRPQIVTAHLPRVDAFVMAWLPGAEGGGVADVLYGDRPFTGRLPVSWPRAASQEPVNAGDRRYDPLFRYGAGLTTRR